MILLFNAPADCHVLRDNAPGALPTRSAVGESSSLYFLREIQEYAEFKCHVLRDTFRMDEPAQVRELVAEQQFDSPTGGGSPLDAA